MPITLAPLHQLGAPKTDAQHKQKVDDAAKKFEGVLLQQMLKVLWKTTPGMNGQQGQMYQSMFEGPFADHLADAGGIGLAKMLSQAMNGPDKPLDKQAAEEGSAQGSAAASTVLGTVRRYQAGAIAGLGVVGKSNPEFDTAVGESTQVQAAAADMLQDGGEQWAKNGTLQETDLRSQFVTETPGGAARFSVRDAQGYAGYYKCNLFAFEMARRAGFEVPVVARDSGWGFPSSNAVTQDASDGRMDRDWSRVATGESSDSLDAAARDGSRAFMLSAAGTGDGHGHMAMVERIHDVEYGKDGQVQRIVFDGWEARPDGASHLSRRTWNINGHEGGHLAHNGFTRIEILELRRPTDGSPEVPLSKAARASALDDARDDSRSSASFQRPRSRSEDES